MAVRHKAWVVGLVCALCWTGAAQADGNEQNLKHKGELAQPEVRPPSAWSVTVDGHPLVLRTSRTLKEWNPYRYGSFEVKGGETVAVTGPDGKTETFVATKPFKRVFDPSRRKDVLVLFGDAPDRNVPDRNDPKVRWFGPGEHEAGPIKLTDGETLYLAPGAVVRGSLYARGRGITVTGRGILTGERYEKCKGPFAFFTYFDHCTNLVIRGVTLTEPYHWTLVVSQSRKVLIDDVRLCCGNILNDDGIDLLNASEVVIRDTFVRTQDDNVAIKGMDGRPKGRYSPCEDIRVEDCLFWTDRANVFRIGYECNASVMRNISACGVYVHAYSRDLRPVEDWWANCIFWLQPSNGMAIENCLFEDVRIRSDGSDMPLVIAEPRCCACFALGEESNPYRHDAKKETYKTGGSVDGVVFRNVTVEGARGEFRGKIFLNGQSPTMPVKNIRFERCSRFGEPIVATSHDVTIGERFTQDVSFAPDGHPGRAE